MCGRQNELPEQFQKAVDQNLMALRQGEDLAELQDQQVEFAVDDVNYLPATVDAAGLQSDFLNPGEVSHVQANVLAAPLVQQQMQHRQRILDSAKNPSYPTSKRLDQKQIFVEWDYDQIQNSGAQISRGLKFIQILIVPVTFNSVYQGVLGQIFSEIADNEFVVPVFYLDTGFVFSARGDMLEIVGDPFSGEGLLPLPLEELLWKNVENKANILQYLYSRADRFDKQVFKLGEVLAGCVSALQRTGGQVTLVLTERISAGLGGIPADSLKLYEMTNSANLQTAAEASLFNQNDFFLRLADEAAGHNVAVNVVGLPFNYQNLGLAQLYPLCLKTGGQMRLNQRAFYCQQISETGNNLYVAEILKDILRCPAIQATATIRTSTGISLAVFETPLQTNFGKKGFSYGDELFGAFQKQSDVEFSFCQLLHESTFCCGLKVDDLQGSGYLQLAVLFTDRAGQRCVRVNTIQLKSSAQAADVENGSSQAGLAAYFARKAAFSVLQGGKIAALGQPVHAQKPVADKNFRGDLQGDKKLIVAENQRTGNFSPAEIAAFEKPKTLQQPADGAQILQNVWAGFDPVYKEFLRVLAGFRDLCGNKATGRLLVPQTQQLLPLYLSCIARTPMLARPRAKLEGGAVTADARIADAMFYVSAPVFRAVQQLYPGLYCLSENPQGIPAPSQANSAWMKESFKNIYLFIQPQSAIVLVGRQVSEELLDQIIGAEQANKHCIAGFKDQHIQRLYLQLKQIYGQKGGIYVAKPDSPMEEQMRWLLVEDAMTKYKSYYDFLNQIQGDVAGM